VLNRVLHPTVRPETRFWPITWLLIRIAWWLIFIHLLEIAVWALFFWLQKCLPDVESSFYFSGVTYATIGYGDLVLLKEWRLFGPVEGLTGILMCGLSTAFFFIVVSKRILQRMDGRDPNQPA
jgi:Ion channel